MTSGLSSQCPPLHRYSRIASPLDSLMPDQTGTIVLELGNPKTAEARARQAESEHPGNGLAHRNLGVTLLAQGKAEPAVAYFNRGNKALTE